MSSFMEVKEAWLKRLTQKEIEGVTVEIKETLKDDTQGNQALSLLATISHEIYNNKVTDIKPDHIFQVCILCMESVGFKNVINEYRLICSAYHILKYLISQNHLDSALKLSSFIFTFRCKADDDESTSALYGCFFSLYKVFLSRYQETLSGREAVPTLLSICKCSLQFLACCVGKYLVLILDTAANVLTAMKSNTADSLQVVQFAIDVLELTSHAKSERGRNVKHTDLFKAYMHYLSSALQYVIKARCLEFSGNLTEKVIQCVQAWIRPNKASDDCVVFLKAVQKGLFDSPNKFKTTILPCIPMLERLVLLHGDHFVNWTCMVITQTVKHLFTHWSSGGVEELKELFPVESQRMLCAFLFPLSEVLLNGNCCKCVMPNGEECVIKHDTFISVDVLSNVISCASLSLAKKLDGCTLLLPDARSAISEIISRFKILKTQNCPQWKDKWSPLAIIIYNIGVHCKCMEMLSEAKEFYSNFCWSCLELGHQPAFPETNVGVLGRCMLLLSQTQRALKKLRSALRIVALAFVVAPDMKDRLISEWAKIKQNKCNGIQELTIYDVLKEDKELIALRCPDVDFSKIDFAQLLLWELEAYCRVHLPNLEVGQAAFEKLCSLPSVSNALKMKGLFLLLPPVWVHGSVSQILHIMSTVEEFKGKSETFDMNIPEQMCLFGNTYYWLFLCQIKVTRSKHEAEIRRSTMIPIKCEKEEDNPDPLAKCDVTPAYKNLDIDNESKVLRFLNEALSYWSNALETGLGTVSTDLNPLPLMEAAAFMYELYGYEVQMLKTWSMICKGAEVLQNKEILLRGICHLLQWCSCEMSECKLVKRANELLNELHLQEEEKYESQLLYHKYLLGYASHCLRSEKFSEIPEYLEKLSEFTRRDRLHHLSQSILYVRVGLLSSQCKLLPLPYTVSCPSRSKIPAMNEAKSTYAGVLSITKQENMTPLEYAEILSVMLEVSLWLGQLYLNLFWPREARAIMKGELLLSQKLGLATRTSQFLNVLALVDIMCYNTDDSQVKLQGIEVLLQLESRNQPYDEELLKNKKSEVEELCSKMKTLKMKETSKMLQVRDEHAFKYCDKSPLASPVLRKIKFVTPSFIAHNADCDCNLCNSLAFHTLVLYATYIQAEIYNIKNEEREAVEFFEGALVIYERLMNKQEHIVKKLNSTLNQLVFGEETLTSLQLLYLPLKLGYVRVMKGYADFIAAGTLYERALKMNSKILHLDTISWKHNYHLYNDAFNQKCCIKEAMKPKKLVQDGEEMPQTLISTELPKTTCKTPLNGSSTFNIQKCPSTLNREIIKDFPYRLKPKKLNLSTENDDDFEREYKSPVPTKTPYQRIEPKSNRKFFKYKERHEKNTSQNVVYCDDNDDNIFRPPEDRFLSSEKADKDLKRARGFKTYSKQKKDILFTDKNKRVPNIPVLTFDTYDIAVSSPETGDFIFSNKASKSTTKKPRKTLVERTQNKLLLSERKAKQKLEFVDLSGLKLEDSENNDIFDIPISPKYRNVNEKSEGARAAETELKRTRGIKTYSKQKNNDSKVTSNFSVPSFDIYQSSDSSPLTVDSEFPNKGSKSTTKKLRNQAVDKPGKVQVSETKLKQLRSRRKVNTGPLLSSSEPSESSLCNTDNEPLIRRTQVQGRFKPVVSDSSHTESMASSSDNSSCTPKSHNSVDSDIRINSTRKKQSGKANKVAFIFTPQGLNKKIELDEVIVGSSPENVISCARKLDILSNSCSDNDEPKEEGAQPAKRRGRPKKETNQEKKPARTRGRPKKGTTANKNPFILK